MRLKFGFSRTGSHFLCPCVGLRQCYSQNVADKQDVKVEDELDNLDADYKIAKEIVDERPAIRVQDHD